MKLHFLIYEFVAPFLLVLLGMAAGGQVLEFNTSEYTYWFIQLMYVALLIAMITDIRNSGLKSSWNTVYDKTKNREIYSLWPKWVLILSVIVSLVLFLLFLWAS